MQAGTDSEPESPHTNHTQLRCQTGSPFDFLSMANVEQETTTNLTSAEDDVEMVTGWKVSGAYVGAGVCDTFTGSEKRLQQQGAASLGEFTGSFISEYEDSREECMRSCESTPTCTHFAYCDPEVTVGDTGGGAGQTCEGRHRHRCELYTGCTKTGAKEAAVPISKAHSNSYCRHSWAAAMGDTVNVAVDVGDAATAADCDAACAAQDRSTLGIVSRARSGYFGYKETNPPGTPSLCRCYTPAAESCAVTAGGSLDLYVIISVISLRRPLS